MSLLCVWVRLGVVLGAFGGRSVSVDALMDRTDWIRFSLPYATQMRSPCMDRFGCSGRLGRISNLPGPSVSTRSISLPPGFMASRTTSLRKNRVSPICVPGRGTGVASTTLFPVATTVLSVLSFPAVSKSISSRSEFTVVRAVSDVEINCAWSWPWMVRITMPSSKSMSNSSAAYSTLRPGSSWTPRAIWTLAERMTPLSSWISLRPASMRSVSRVSFETGKSTTFESRSV